MTPHADATIGGTETARRLGSSALITIDVQRDTLDGQPFEISGTSAAAAALGDLCRAYRAAGLPIIHVVRLYLADGSNAEPFRRQLVSGPTPMLRPGTPGRLLAPELGADTAELDDELLLAGDAQQLGPVEWVVYKPRWGAFHRTPLETMLRDLAVTTVVIGGCNFPNCPRASIVEASERDFEVIVPAGGLSGLDERGEQELAGIGVEVAPIEQLRRLIDQR